MVFNGQIGLTTCCSNTMGRIGISDSQPWFMCYQHSPSHRWSFVVTLSNVDVGLEPPNDHPCPEYDVDLVGNDIAYAAGEPTWQSCGELISLLKLGGYIFCLRCLPGHVKDTSAILGSWINLKKPRMIFRRSVQVRSRGLQVLDMGSGDANVPLQVVRWRLSEAQRHGLWQSVLPQGSGRWGVLPCSSASQFWSFISLKLYPYWYVWL